MQRREHPTSKHTPEFDPCFYEAKKVIDCINDLTKDKKRDCQIYAENVKHCRDFWAAVQKDRKKKGIKPHLPTYYDRPKVREEYKDLLEEVKSTKTSACVIQ